MDLFYYSVDCVKVDYFIYEKVNFFLIFDNTLNIVEVKKVRIIFVFSRYKKEHKICYHFPKDKQKKINSHFQINKKIKENLFYLK